MSGIIEWEALGLVVGVGLLVGGGLPALFALGLRFLTARPALADDGTPEAPGAARRVAGYLCLAVCVAAVFMGLFFLVSGGH
ncbi:hypothetical protein [Antribacter gilvus]|uniref:hypothetical protein n=1 Tax=Antribacter gilvus TaxID=2304675 RepID=UPI000F7714A2|nr:hypothetical protein [Antribacter gilvus]